MGLIFFAFFENFFVPILTSGGYVGLSIATLLSQHHQVTAVDIVPEKVELMDLIICASISRFARNFSDCMTQIAALKTMHPAHPIGRVIEALDMDVSKFYHGDYYLEEEVKTMRGKGIASRKKSSI